MGELDASRDCQLSSGLLLLKRWACGNYIFMTIGEKFLLISGLIPINLILSSSTGDFFHAE